MKPNTLVEYTFIPPLFQIMYQLLKKMNQKELLTCRAVCTSLKEMIDSKIQFHCYLNSDKIQMLPKPEMSIDRYTIGFLPLQLPYKFLLTLKPPKQLSITKRISKIDLFFLAYLWSPTIQELDFSLFALESTGLFRTQTSTRAPTGPMSMTEYFPEAKKLSLSLVAPYEKFVKGIYYRLQMHKMCSNLQRMSEAPMCLHLTHLQFNFENFPHFWQPYQCYFMAVVFLIVAKSASTLRHLDVKFKLKQLADAPKAPDHASIANHHKLVNQHLGVLHEMLPNGLPKVQCSYIRFKIGSLQPCSTERAVCDWIPKIISQQRSLEHLTLETIHGLNVISYSVKQVLPQNYSTLVKIDLKIELDEEEYFDLSHLALCNNLNTLRLINATSKENSNDPNQIKRHDSDYHCYRYSSASFRNKFPYFSAKAKIPNLIFSDSKAFPTELRYVSFRGFTTNLPIMAELVQAIQNMQCMFLEDNYIQSHRTETGFDFFEKVWSSESLKFVTFLPTCSGELMRSLYRNSKCHMKIEKVMETLNEKGWELQWDFDETECKVANPNPNGFVLKKSADVTNSMRENIIFD